MSKSIENKPSIGSIKLRGRSIDLRKKTLIMGILNATPDSFSDGGLFNQVDRAVRRAVELAEEGADIIDIGGESTRPGSERVPVEVELERVIPIVKNVRKAVDVPISIDTYKAEVARQALSVGADMINDIWGAKKDPEMAAVAAEFQVPIVLMHNRTNQDYKELIDDIIFDLQKSIEIAVSNGVKDENIILDPGIGFAKSYEDNLIVMKNLEKITALGYPVLLGTSRKSFIGKTLNLSTEDRIEGTGATVCLGIEKGCHIVRVHDVEPIARMVKMMDAMLKGVVASG